MDPLWHETLALSLAVLFAAAGLEKLRAFGEWPQLLENYDLLPAGLARPVALALPLAELATAFGLAVGSADVLSAAAALGGGALGHGALGGAAVAGAALETAAALAAAALLLVFALAIAVNVRRGRTSIDCGCLGGRLRQRLAPWMVGRNLVLAAAALLLLVPISARGLTAIDWVGAAGATLTLALLYPVLMIVLGSGIRDEVP